MAYKLLILGDMNSRVVELLMTRFEELPYTINQLSDADFQSDTLHDYWQTNQPSIVIHVPNLSAPDTELAASITHIQQVIQYCEQSNTPIIQLSSYKVFGEAASAQLVDEADPKSIPDIIADQRVAQFERVVSGIEAHVILRSSWVVDDPENGLLEAIMPHLVEEGRASVVVSDQNYGAPVFSRSIADAIIAIVQQILCGAENWGIFQFHSADSCSEAEFTDHLVRMIRGEFELDCDVPDVTAVEDSRRLMSGNAYLKGRRLTDGFGIQMLSWRNGLKGEVKRWLASHAISVPNPQQS